MAYMDIAFANGVSLFEPPVNGMRGNYYEPYYAGSVDDLEALADTYFFYFQKESQRKFKYYAKLTNKQRERFNKERKEYNNAENIHY